MSEAMSPARNPMWIAGATLLIVLRSAALQAAAADDLQPAVQTSTAAAPAVAPPANAPAASGTVAPPGRSAPPAPGQPPAPGKPAAPGQPAAPGKPPARAGAGVPAAARPGGAHDRVELDTTQITGNRELPNVMYVVPWKKPELGDFGGRPPKSLLDELLAPVDRDVFRRQNRYYSGLKAGAAAGQGVAAGTDAGGAAAGSDPAAPAPRIAVDEK